MTDLPAEPAVIAAAATPEALATMLPVLVLGIGNMLLSDESVGLKAVAAFAQRYHLPPEITVLDGGTAGMDLLDPIAAHRTLIVVDAARMHRPPGTISIWRGPDVTELMRTKISPHQLGLGDVLAGLTLLEQMPAHVAIIAIEPADLDLGLDLSPALAERFDDIVTAIAEECRDLGLAIVPVQSNHATP